jgi:hypothetical protein
MKKLLPILSVIIIATGPINAMETSSKLNHSQDRAILRTRVALAAPPAFAAQMKNPLFLDAVSRSARVYNALDNLANVAHDSIKEKNISENDKTLLHGLVIGTQLAAFGIYEHYFGPQIVYRSEDQGPSIKIKMETEKWRIERENFAKKLAQRRQADIDRINKNAWRVEEKFQKMLALNEAHKKERQNNSRYNNVRY